MNVNPRASSQKAPPRLEYQKDELCITKERVLWMQKSEKCRTIWLFSYKSWKKVRYFFGILANLHAKVNWVCRVTPHK